MDTTSTDEQTVSVDERDERVFTSLGNPRRVRL
jgi:hypothetical protein